MLVRLILVAVLMVAVFFFYLYQINTTEAIFYLTTSKSYETPLIVMLLISLGAGALLVILISLAADLRNAISNWQLRKNELAKRKARKMEVEGQKYLAEGWHSRAKDSFLAALDKDPTLVPALLGGSRACSFLNDSEQGRALLERAKGLCQGDNELLLAVAEGNQALGALKEALDICQKLPRGQDSIMVSRKLTELYQQAGMWREAWESQKEVVRLSAPRGLVKQEEKTLLWLRYKYALSLLTLGDLDGANQALKEIVRQHPEFTPAQVTLGDCLLRQGKNQDAAEVWERAFLLHQAMVFLLRLEELYLSREEPDTVIRLYQRALTERAGFPLPRLFLARLYLRLEMLDEALEHLNHLAGTGEDSPFFHQLLGEVYRRRNLTDKAAEEFTRALGFRRRPSLPFVCQSCQREFTEWSGICPGCDECGTLGLKPEHPEA
ncbi:MAG: lipopolysaccharide assembly protein LapA domain-containing protein [Thermodesulfobacteriota bacterium]